MFEQLAAWRLRLLSDECRVARHCAIDPLTQKELAQFEKLFRAMAMEVETSQRRAEKS